MKIARYEYQGSRQYGVVEAETISPVSGSIYGEFEVSSEKLPLHAVKLLPPVEPRKLICVGLNYALHAKESNAQIPEEPMIFMCSTAAIIGDGESIVLDSSEQRIDFEAEIAFIIKKQAKNRTAAEAKQYILGYTCANDVSNRDLQRKDGQFTRAKSFDTYKPLGPWVETDIDPNNLNISLRQNGVVKQSSNTNDMIFSVEQIFEFVSHVMTLEPGDVILTGTPSGVGPMQSGDVIEIEIEGIGHLTNKVQ
ncbi:fumarylacetoacetate hydrolase family protein [Brevibacillus sp. B_LB10_24]|uniref:fumarylacetoacetate hydrolase family protein n=1 Tax=Brevibacillus sp. B_LB10_24 TaxID=3380645 RepID=UPI0038BA4A2E